MENSAIVARQKANLSAEFGHVLPVSRCELPPLPGRRLNGKLQKPAQSRFRSMRRKVLPRQSPSGTSLNENHAITRRGPARIVQGLAIERVDSSTFGTTQSTGRRQNMPHPHDHEVNHGHPRPTYRSRLASAAADQSCRIFCIERGRVC
jgi:hypothetical protein